MFKSMRGRGWTSYRALRTFLRVAETGSFSAAAIDLDLTQPAVSRQVSALEAHLNTRLLHRTTSALALTVEGEQTIADGAAGGRSGGRAQRSRRVPRRRNGIGKGAAQPPRAARSLSE